VARLFDSSDFCSPVVSKPVMSIGKYSEPNFKSLFGAFSRGRQQKKDSKTWSRKWKTLRCL